MNLVLKTITKKVGNSIYKFNYVGKSSLHKNYLPQKINPDSLELASPGLSDTLEINARKDIKALLDYKMMIYTK